MPLQDLPEALGELKRLKVLALDLNRIAAVPAAVFKGCTSLSTLTLHENPITIEVGSTLSTTRGLLHTIQLDPRTCGISCHAWEGRLCWGYDFCSTLKEDSKLIDI